MPENGELETFIVQKTTGLTDVEIDELSSHLKPMSKEKAQELAEFIETRIDLYLDEHFKQS